MSSNGLPLANVRVYELGSNLAAPYAGWILAQLGAEVIKIERPEGDDARSWGPPFWRESSVLFQVVNRDKKSVALDLKDPRQAAELRSRIAREADVVLQNMRPGVAEALGMSAETLRAENPRLVYCNMGAFGKVGPLRDNPGYDTLVQAFGGLMSVTGDEGGIPVRSGVALVDMGTGMWCVIGIVSALFRRELTGQGCTIDASLYETALGWMTIYAGRYQASGELPVRRPTATGAVVPYQGYACADGELVIGASNDRLFQKLAQALDRQEWLSDERFRTNPQRVSNRDELNRMLGEILIEANREHWQRLFDRAGVPSAAIQNIAEVLAHPQTAALNMMQPSGDPGINFIGFPLSFDGIRPALKNVAPTIGQHTDVWRRKI